VSWMHSPLPTSAAYDGVQRKLEGEDCVLVDGGVSTELERAQAHGPRAHREPWGVWALYSAQTEVLDVHRRYVAAGCDVLSTNSWSILEEAEEWDTRGAPRAWGQAADAALRLARTATRDSSREADCAVAFCINGNLRGPRALSAVELLTWRWQEEAPDLVIFETLTELPGGPLLDAVSMVRELGLPVWVGMRRGATGMASVDGEMVPDEDPEQLRAGVGELERRGVSALLVNCVPRELIVGGLYALAAVSSLPLGCLPNLGRPADGGWAHGDRVSAEEFADEALVWRETGAQVIGGCCGTGPEEIRALRRVLDRALAWSARGV
jgi:homocysteine S-methyltransferase